ncbi:NAD(P)-binding domain-containing protein [Candidatus Pelagibacter sp.]|nr:NAD(P)-binding domain-containing protein [Candidatus Pelagibacter sp.]
MKLGFIGTGKIASSVITGICKSSIKYNKIFISSRNEKISKELKKRFKKIIIERDNQQIINKSNWVF